MIRAYRGETIRAAEQPLLDAGVPLMRHAAQAVAMRAVRELRSRGAKVAGSVVLALVGGGNNGGDALFAAADLARRGVSVHAVLCSQNTHAAGLAAARTAGVRLIPLIGPDGFANIAELIGRARRSGIWLDGLAGIGLTGPLREPLAGIISALQQELASSPDQPIVIAIDVPSGLGDSGAMTGPVLQADVTVTFGAAKPALLLPPAANLAGELEVIDLDLPLAAQEPAALRLTASDAADTYAWPRQSDHKYTRGVAGIWAGSARYPGAAALAVAGALGVGPGMVRYLGEVDLTRYPEVVTVPGRVQAALVGSGMEPARAGKHLAAALELGVPTVVDAGGLTRLDAAMQQRQVQVPVIVTPHAGELAAMLGVSRAAVEADPARFARGLAERLGVIVLIKGPITLVVPPSGPIISQRDTNAWLATAGAGDVLAGMVTALLALAQTRAEENGSGLGDAAAAQVAAAAVWIHSRAAVSAAGTPSGPIRAGEIAGQIPAVIAAMQE